ncbi:MAG TPA: YaeQ family protein [Crenotrichaceae bacterium]|nr:YaeQ family protein [Crenotrichaceae bacterium]
MALKSTIYKLELEVFDIDNNIFQTHELTVARHPSETDERMMVRILVFALHSNQALSFTKGLSSEDQPALWQRDLTNQIEIWIDLGQADESRIRKACSRADQVFIYTYNQRSASVWWKQLQDKLHRFKNLTIIHLADDVSQTLTSLVQRNMQLQCTIQDDQVWLGNSDTCVAVQAVIWKCSNSESNPKY